MSVQGKPATVGQKRRIRALVESSGRTLDDVLTAAERFGLGKGDLEGLSKVEALRIIEALLSLREVNGGRPGKLPEALAAIIGREYRPERKP